VEAALNITLNFILGKFFGVNGVILATLISMWSIFFYSSGLVYKGYFKHEKVSDYLWSCLRFILTGAVSIALCYIICKFIPNGSGAGMRILFLFCKLIISSAVSFAVTFLILQNDKIFPAAKDFVVRIVKKRNK
jgi:peptidoglycan biosynthesis protein MviN/MurJ (putative lipid II flippase)